MNMTIGTNEIRSNEDIKRRTSKGTVYRHVIETGKMTQRDIEYTTYRSAKDTDKSKK
jgi:hypothetical protein